MRRVAAVAVSIVLALIFLVRPAAAHATQEQATTDQAAATVDEQESAEQGPEPDQERAVDDLRENDRPLTGSDLVDDDFPRSWPLFGSDYRMNISGYVKLDMLYDTGGTGDQFQFVTGTIPVEGTPEDLVGPYTKMHVRETRMGFDVRNTSGEGPPQKLYVEFDFFQEDPGPFNVYPRLRHAYFVIGDFLIGRTWGALTDGRSIAPTIDFAAGDALFATRANQVRWERRIAENTKFLLAVQSNEFTSIQNDTGRVGEPSPLVPFLASRIEQEWGRGSFVMLGGLVTQLRWDAQDGGDDATAAAWSLAFSGRWALSERDYLRWNSGVGKGTGGQIISLAGRESSAVLRPDGRLETLPVWSASVGYGHRLTDTVLANVTAAWSEVTASEFSAADAIKAAGSAHLTLLWDVTEAFTTGVEFMVGRRVNTDDRRGNSSRLQMMGKYSF